MTETPLSLIITLSVFMFIFGIKAYLMWFKPKYRDRIIEAIQQNPLIFWPRKPVGPVLIMLLPVILFIFSSCMLCRLVSQLVLRP